MGKSTLKNIPVIQFKNHPTENLFSMISPIPFKTIQTETKRSIFPFSSMLMRFAVHLTTKKAIKVLKNPIRENAK